MFACKYNGGVSSKRIINAFEFLKKRSEEAALAAQREATELRQKAQQALTGAGGEEEDDQNTPGDEEAEENSEDGSGLVVRRTARLVIEDQAEKDFPKGGAGLVSLMGDLSSLETRIQGNWKLTIKAGGRCLLMCALGLCLYSAGAVDFIL